ncbi:MAG: hypothetical protein AABW50_03545 [Nanoarchaeota archaeon]
MLTKKAQTSETLTWIVATIAIVIILYISILVASAQDSVKNVLNLDKKVTYNDFREGEKSLHGVLLANNGEVYYSIRDKDNLEDSGEFVKNVLEQIYRDKYEKIWFGVFTFDSFVYEGKDNSYFGDRPGVSSNGSRGVVDEEHSVSNSVYLKDNLYVELLLTGEKDEN